MVWLQDSQLPAHLASRSMLSPGLPSAGSSENGGGMWGQSEMALNYTGKGGWE